MGGTSDASQVTLELHGFLATRLAHLGERHGTRVHVAVELRPEERVRQLLERLVRSDARCALLFEPGTGRLPEHVEAVLNGRVLDLQGGLEAPLAAGDVLAFLPAHAGG